MTYKDKRGYEREHSNAVHRNRAYSVYLQNRNKYPLPFSAYEVHHIDFDKSNNRISNLAILTPEEHDRLHEEREKWIAKEKEILRDEERKERKENWIVKSVLIVGVIVSIIILKNLLLPLGIGLILFGLYKWINERSFFYFIYIIFGVGCIAVNGFIQALKSFN